MATKTKEPVWKTRAIWEGELLFERVFGDSEILANAHFDSAVSDYGRKDLKDTHEVTIQLIHGESVIHEHHFHY